MKHVTGFSSAVLILLYQTAAAPQGNNSGCIDYDAYYHWAGTVDLPGISRGTDVAGSYLYVANGQYGLQVVDVSDPASPVLVGSVDSVGASDVAVSGNYAYVVSWSRFYVINVSDPVSPVIVGETDVAGETRGVAVSGAHAYVASARLGLQIINVLDPSAPVVVGSIEMPGYTSDVKVSGNHAYVADWFSSLKIIDITNPASPSLVAEVETESNFGVDVVGTLAYVGDRSGLRIFDVSQPASPTIVGALDDTSNPTDLSVAGSHVYAAVGGGLFVYDVSDPTAPERLNFIRYLGTERITISDQHCYLSGWFCDHFECHPLPVGILDISSPGASVILGRTGLPGTARDAALSDTWLHVANDVHGLRVLDISDPGSPEVVGAIDTPGRAWAVALAGSHAFVADEESGLHVIDVSDHLSPEIVGTVDTPGLAVDVGVSGTYAYVADMTSGLQVVDVSDPVSPLIVGNTTTPTFSTAVSVMGSKAYVADYHWGLQVVDVTDPTMPVIISTVDTPGHARGLAVAGSHAYIADWDSGLQIIDISNPLQPTLVGATGVPGKALDVTVGGLTAYVAVGDLGLAVIDVSNPASPSLVGVISDPGNTSGAAVSEVLYVIGDYMTSMPVQCSGFTSVDLLTFESASGRDGITLTWTTGHESELLGFNVQRSEEATDGFARVNLEPIRSSSPYRFLDKGVEAGVTYHYRLEALDRSGGRQYFGPISATASTADRHRPALGANHPNPFRSGAGSTSIPFYLAREGDVSLRILDVLGRQVRVLVDRSLDAGEHTVFWDGRNDWGDLVSAGVYFYQLGSPGFQSTRRLVWLR